MDFVAEATEHAQELDVASSANGLLSCLGQKHERRKSRSLFLIFVAGPGATNDAEERHARCTKKRTKAPVTVRSRTNVKRLQESLVQ